MKNKLIAIGEALIDFIPKQSGAKIKEVTEFKPIVGGAPANVCGAFTKLGGTSEMVTKLGADPFGDKIVDEFKQYGIGCDLISRTTEANTSLAFVALEADGGREFSFYRKPGADMLLKDTEVKKEWFDDAFALHFCSVSLGDFPMKEAHRSAIKYAKEAGAIISFDPNLRLPLWEDHEELKRVVLEFLPYADIVKISDEELFFITGETEIEKAKEVLFTGDVKLIIYTLGSEGAEAFNKSGKAFAKQKKVEALDTTGAGDAFIGSFLYQLCADGVEKEELSSITEQRLETYLARSNQYCGESVTKHGAIASYPSKLEFDTTIV
ncbi:MAG: carbohydrate kinase [bacterium]|nr:carbohydrate kinase [bacterium]